MLTARGRIALVLLFLFLLAITPFVPLLIAIIEESFFGTRYTETVFRRIGLHETLDNFYDKCWDLIRR